MLLGMDVIERMRVMISNDGVRFLSSGCCTALDLCIEDPDFSATFEQANWGVEWK